MLLLLCDSTLPRIGLLFSLETILDVYVNEQGICVCVCV